MDRFTNRFHPESRFGGFTDIDGTVAFYGRIHALIDSGSTVIDFGCGRGALADDPVPYRRNLRILRGKVGMVIGLDVDPVAATNPYIDKYVRLEAGSEAWPVADSSADLVISDNVMEHLPSPPAFFREVARVLRPGGHLCVRTPNAYGYVGIAARLIPETIHSRVLRRVQDERKDADVFPAYYRCNTRARIIEQFRLNGFVGIVSGFESEPRYLEFSSLAYRLGLLYARIAPAGLRNCLLGYARRE